MDRRKFVYGGFLLGAQSAFGHPVLRLMEAIVNDSARKAYADTTGGVRNYLNIGYLGGPLRYTFDAWLRTNDSDPSLIFNPMTATAFTSSGNAISDVEYRTMTYKGLLVPHLFSQSVNISSGTVPLTNYLDQMLVIRGYGTGVDGHPQNFNLQQKPLAGKPSIAGLSADSSSRSFEAVQFPPRGTYSDFSSAKNIALNTLSGNKPAHVLMNGISSSTSARTLRNAHSEAMDMAKARLAAVTGTQNNSSAVARKSLDNAMALIKKGAGDLDGYWNEAYNRYYKIVHTAMRTTGLVGINDKVINLASKASSMTDDNYSQIARKYNLAYADANGHQPHAGYDGSQLTNQIVTNDLCEGLALAEYAYSNGLVTSLELMPGIPSNLNFQSTTDDSSQLIVATHDMHNTGSYYGLLLTTMMFRGLMAGLLELRSRLQAAKNSDGSSVWSKTVVQIMSDFNRSARADGSGSDHGYNQMITSIFSGAFDNGPEVIGNVARDSGSSQYSGSQGLGAPITGYSQSGRPDTKAMASTVSQLLNVNGNPWANLAEPLLSLSGTKLVLPYGRGKVIG